MGLIVDQIKHTHFYIQLKHIWRAFVIFLPHKQAIDNADVSQ